MPTKADPDLRWEPSPGLRVGVDEVGRGCLAGPILAGAAVFLPNADIEAARTICDSKTLSGKRRRRMLEKVVLPNARVAVAGVSAKEIDRIGIAPANRLAMTRAWLRLGLPDAEAVVDGREVPPDIPGVAVVKGDARVPEVGAAAIAAKVLRDDAMAKLDRVRPGYGWARNVGYGTAEHRESVRTLGPTPHHRRSFKGAM